MQLRYELIIKTTSFSLDVPTDICVPVSVRDGSQYSAQQYLLSVLLVLGRVLRQSHLPSLQQHLPLQSTPVGHTLSPLHAP